jgi:hypothetical protein
MKFIVITDTPDMDDPQEAQGNLATALGSLHLASNGSRLGLESLAFYIPVFVRGEILICDDDGREKSGRGRKPNKWGCTYDTYDTLGAALERVRDMEEN